MNTIRKLVIALLLLAAAGPGRAAEYQLFARTNLATWCIVPFDAKHRGSEARAQMLENLGITKFAYDWRTEQIPTFDAEVAAMKRHGVEVIAWWFPGALNAEARASLDCIKRNGIHPQLWVMMEGGPHLRLNQAFEKTPAAQAAHVARIVAGVKPIAAEAAKLGCQVALYTHGGWFGIPENLIEIIKQLKQDGVENVGMVYTQHHGHGDIDRFEELFPKMKPYLLAVTLNGMIKDGDLMGSHDLGTAPLGQGDQDLRLLRIIKESGWTGPVGIVGETESVDVELRLRDHLDGLDWLVAQLDGKPAGPQPVPRSWKRPAPRVAAAPATATGVASISAAFGKALRGGMNVAGKAEYRQRPLTVECWAKLDSSTGFNIFIASDTKASAEHWSLYSTAGSGTLSVYQPGRGGVFDSGVNVCDSKWHYLAAIIEPERVRLFVDGKLAKELPATPLAGTPLPDELAFGRIVEGGLDCDGVVDDVRLSRGAREISGIPAGPLTKDTNTIGLWNFDEGAAASESASATSVAPDGNSVSAAFGKALRGGTQVAGKAEYRQRPLTVECWAKLDSATGFNVLVASDTKASAEHWSLYSTAGSGTLSVYQPGCGGVFDSGVNVCDSKWHYLAAVIESERVRLFVDGKLAKELPATPLTGTPLPGELAFGRIVEGGLDCDGAVDNVRLSRGAREINGIPAGPLTKDATTLGLWDFDGAANESAPAGEAVAASLPSAFGKALRGGTQVAGKAEYRQRPLTVECWAKLDSTTSYNILVASDTKASAEHWSLYSTAGSGTLSVYQPGCGGVFDSGVNVCDSKWHYLAAVIEPERVRLFVDGKLAKELPATPLVGESMPDDLAFGRIVEGGLDCDGVVDNVRLSRGAREISGVPAGPLTKDATTIDLWNFEDIGTAATGKVDYWAVEDATARAALPEFRTIPPALPSELTPANGFPKRETFRNWERSHGDNSGARYSALTQINRQNVTNLQAAWTYHSKDGAANIQCNPIIADGVMFAPTAGEHIVAINAATGVELWRFKPGGRPAHRGLIYWPGEAAETPRIFFTAGNILFALNPKTGQPVASFGQNGRITLPGAAVVAPTIFEHIIVVPGFQRDVWGLDLISGKLLWTFHTVPRAGEFGFDTWDRPEAYSANCWGGMALDEVRGIAYVTTGSPKDNFIGVSHRGDNLFANCVIAIDARTGKRLWHFQEIHHDIWDLDLPAPPNLTTITRDGKRVDVVATVTKIGNTLLLDRVTGKPIFPYRERRAPASTLPGEQTSPYQPDLELPQPFAKQEFAAADITDRSEEATSFVKGRFKSSTVGFFQPASEGKMNLFFSILGGANWPGACVDPESGRLYVTASHTAWIISAFRDEDPPYNPNAPRTPGQGVYEVTCASCHGTNRVGVGMAPALRGLRFRTNDKEITEMVRAGKNGMPAMPNITDADMQALTDFLMLRDQPVQPKPSKSARPRYSYNGYPEFLDHEGYPGNKPPWGTLDCIDLNSGKKLWTVPLGEYPELTVEGIPKTGTKNFGGAMVTAGGLVFCAGTRDSKIRAFDKDTGAELWSATLPWVGSAPPACYEVDGRQFIVVAATGGGKLATPVGDAYVAFALPSPKP